MEKISFSVIISIYNGVDYISQCLDSVMKQLPSNCECVVVDDGSTDDTKSVLYNYVKRYENLKIYINEHKGVSATRNCGIKHAKGDYITFLDGDDLYIFSIDNTIIDDGIKEIVTWQVENKRYNCASEFADDYIRKRSLLLYSLCNKFYVRSIIVSNSLELKENMAFGEDRVFN